MRTQNEFKKYQTENTYIIIQTSLYVKDIYIRGERVGFFCFFLIIERELDCDRKKIKKIHLYYHRRRGKRGKKKKKFLNNYILYVIKREKGK